MPLNPRVEIDKLGRRRVYLARRGRRRLFTAPTTLRVKLEGTDYERVRTAAASRKLTPAAWSRLVLNEVATRWLAGG